MKIIMEKGLEICGKDSEFGVHVFVFHDVLVFIDSVIVIRGHRLTYAAKFISFVYLHIKTAHTRSPKVFFFYVSESP